MIILIIVLKKHYIIVLLCLLIVIALLTTPWEPQSLYYVNAQEGKKYIKWVDFTVPYKALDKTIKLDISTYGTEHHFNWIEVLAYLAAKYYGNFSNYKPSDIDNYVQKIKEGSTVEELTKNLKYYDFYLEAYTAILGEFVGEYSIEERNPDNPEEKILVKKYGLKVFSPIAKGYGYSHSDDFGNGRTYGFRRKHLGNDLMAGVGTPIIAVESGIIEALGWNRYGGWRVGIRSLDGKRYYYYAHLRKGHPYNSEMAVGQPVVAGDVIGYVGMTGYSLKEDVNNINVPHLHFGLQLIFDESQKDGINQIWIDVYNIVKLLERNRSAVEKSEGGKDYNRVYKMIDPVFEKY